MIVRTQREQMRTIRSISIIPLPYAGIIRIRCMKKAVVGNMLLSMGIISACFSARQKREQGTP
jgi:hypothetical protein